MLEVGPAEVNKFRLSQLNKYKSISVELEQEETAIRNDMHREVAAVVANKKIALFQRMLQDIQYDDPGVLEYLTEGVKVMGTLEETGIWAKGGTAPTVSIEAVLRCAKQAQQSMMSRREPTPLDEEVWKITLEEVEDGLLFGPLTPKEVEQKLGPLWTGAKRFGLRQGKKTRPIDDFSVNLINAAFGSKEKISLSGLEEVTAKIRAWMEIASNDRFSILDKGSKLYTGTVHRGWKEGHAMELVGRVADLRRAYKQVPLSPLHSFASVIAVLNPRTGSPSLFISTSLSFGQTAAVYAFLRLSRALSTIASKLFMVGSIAYFDDFTKVEPKATSETALTTFEGLMCLLGWEIAVGPDKRFPFQTVFDSLGARFDLTHIRSGSFKIINKEGRVQSIVELAEQALRSKLPVNILRAIQGKVIFAEGLSLCRVSAPFTNAVAEKVREPWDSKVDELVSWALKDLVAKLQTMRPRVIGHRSKDPPVIIYTDGACEEDVVTIGGVIFPPGGSRPEQFGLRVPERVWSLWKRKPDQKQVIGQAEIMPVIVAKLTWSKYLQGRRVIIFIDNEAARIGLVRSYSPSLPSLRIISASIECDLKLNCMSWYARVPTCANCADAPSRLEGSMFLDSLGCIKVEPVLPDWW